MLWIIHFHFNWFFSAVQQPKFHSCCLNLLPSLLIHFYNGDRRCDQFIFLVNSSQHYLFLLDRNFKWSDWTIPLWCLRFFHNISPENQPSPWIFFRYCSRKPTLICHQLYNFFSTCFFIDSKFCACKSLKGIFILIFIFC